MNAQPRFARLVAIGLWAIGTTITTQSSLGVSAASTTTVSIVGQNGALSFSPNPVPATLGDSLVWTNNDSTFHRIVLDDGSLDTGDISPNASSPALTLTTSGGPYHCSIHPSMVGTIATPVPALPTWAMTVLAALLALAGIASIRRPPLKAES